MDSSTRLCAAVDPVDPAKVVAAAAAHGVKIVSVLTTHQHWDHAGGNLKLLSDLGGEVEVLGGVGK